MKKILLPFFLFFFTSFYYSQVIFNTGAGNWSVPANVTHVNVVAWGGGGGGGGSDSNGNGGNGGGGGGAASSQVGVNFGNTFSYAVGTGGGGGLATGNAAQMTGGNGTASTVTSVLPATNFTANGGFGGRGNRANVIAAGGSATGGATNVDGLPGARANNNGNSGSGGNSGTAFGISGAGGAGLQNAQGNPGGQPGAGASGGERRQNPVSNFPGGVGAAGRVMFDYITVTGITPNPVCVGSTITITGTNFSTAGTTTVTVNGIAATSVAVVSSTTITAVLAAGTTSGTVDITNNLRRYNGLSITVNPAPSNPSNPTSNSPQCNTVGVTLTRTGTPPAGVTWFWQTAANGTATTNSGATTVVNTSGTYYLRARNNTTGCWSTGAGSVSVTVETALTALATTPVPANGATGVCYAGVGAISTLSWTAAAGASSYDVYFGAGSLPGTPTGNVTTNSYSISTLLPNTTYYWRIVPRNSCGVSTGTPVTWSFTTSSTPCYCPSSGGAYPNGITGVVFNTISNTGTSVNSGYQLFTNLSTTVMKTLAYDLSVYIDTGGNFTDHQSVYFDWNGDGDFADAGEFYSLGTATNVTNGLSSLSPLSVTIPAGAITGPVRMRIQSRWNQPTNNPCLTGFDGEVEDYTLHIIDALTCSGMPVGGTVVLNPGSGTPLSTFYASVTGATVATGLTYQWESAPSATGPWTPVAGANSASASITAPGTVTTTYYRRKISCSGVEAYSATASFVTEYCKPTVSNPNGLYINSVAIVGTMADPPVNTTGAGLVTGYSDYTTLSQIAQQAQGEGVNVAASVTGATYFRGTWKAWVDWNNDGNFTDSEVVYTLEDVQSATANFGFAIPTNQPPGNYRLRIRTHNAFGPISACAGSAFGEIEDYLINVISNCSAKITSVTSGSECSATGGKQVTLTATSSEPVSEFRWYTAPAGGTYTASTPVGNTSTTFVTPPITNTTVYYVTAYNGVCESTFRIPVSAIIKPTPEITFTPTALEICGDTGVVAVSATGGNEIKHLIPLQTFEAGNLGVFTNQNNTANDAEINSKVNWQHRTSVYVPEQPDYLSWYPAISSGFGTNNFVMATSDVNAGQTIDKALLSPMTLDSRGLINLTLKLRMFFSRYQTNGINPNTEYVSIEVSTVNSNDNNNWTVIDRITADVGMGTAFEQKTYNLNSYINVQNLRIRIRYYAAGWFDGVAVDDIELYGEQPLQPSFVWTNSNPIEVYTDAAGTTAYTGGPISTIYFKPTDAQLELYDGWNLTATATLANLCDAVGSITITNNTKIWDTASANWNTTNWKPNTTVPSNDKCVIIKTPVNILAGSDGLAKSVRVETGGKLTIQNNSSLTVTDAIVNQAAETDVVVESDGNLIQINDAAVNTGNATVKRNSSMKRLDYTYWGAPVEGQTLKTFSPNTVTNRFYSYNEADDSFSIITPLTNPMIKGQGYVIRAPNNFTTALQTWPATFSGKPHNGTVDVAVTKLGGGKNLVGNPYPSNIDLVQLTSDNSTVLTGTYYFWTNNATWTSNTGGIGTIGNYNGNGYAAWNGSGGVQATNSAGDLVGQVPTRYVKPGQGFLAEVSQAGTVSFKNGIRTKEGGASPFFNRASADHNSEEVVSRFWLTLTTPVQTVSTVLVAYVQGATNAYDPGFDAVFPSEVSDRFFTLNNDKEFLIQGRQFPLTVTDVVSLGMSHYADGNYTIALAEREGVFANGQNVYLRDKATGTVTNLSEGSYTYSAVHGISRDRFEIIYEPQMVLAADGTLNENIQVYRDGSDFVIKSPRKKITGIEVYDSSGKLMVRSGANQTEVRLDGTHWVNGVYVIKIDRIGEITTRKIRK